MAKTRKPIVVTDAPPDYVRISSGLGDAAPVNLIVLPIVFEGQVLGVIEAGSFSLFTQVHQDFLEQLMETIGVSVNTIIANSRTADLLQESQRLAGELQARTGELQVRQEELQSSNAELEDKAAQLASQKRDIEIKNTEIEQARQEIEERARQLDQASRYKSQFLANVSHELRTPLNSLLILARLLAQNPAQNLTPKQVEYANVIHSSGSDLLLLINDILDLSRVEAGKLDVHPEEFALGSLVEDLRSVFEPLAADKRLSFSVTVDPDVPAELVTDRQRLRQVLHNLLSNAVKFTERGEVMVQIQRAVPQGPDDEPAITFSVTDTGIGISDDSLKTIFEAFQQGDGTTSRRYGGTGLGLAISREVAEMLGGLITARSQPGSGSTFTIYLPLARARRPGARRRCRPARSSGNGHLSGNGGTAPLAPPAASAAAEPAPVAGHRGRPGLGAVLGGAAHAAGQARLARPGPGPQGPDRGRRPAQRLRDHQHPGALRAARHPRAERPPGHRGAAVRPGHRPRADGRDDARDGRLRHHGRHPGDAAVRRPAGHRGDRARHAGRPGQEPGRRGQRLRHQARGHRRAAVLHGALAAPGQRRRPVRPPGPPRARPAPPPGAAQVRRRPGRRTSRAATGR